MSLCCWSLMARIRPKTPFRFEAVWQPKTSVRALPERNEKKKKQSIYRCHVYVQTKVFPENLECSNFECGKRSSIRGRKRDKYVDLSGFFLLRMLFALRRRRCMLSISTKFRQKNKNISKTQIAYLWNIYIGWLFLVFVLVRTMSHFTRMNIALWLKQLVSPNWFQYEHFKKNGKNRESECFWFA